MKKIPVEFIIMLLCGILGGASAATGTIILIASIFTSLPTAIGFILLVMGIILMCVVRIYYMLLIVINKFSDTINILTKSVDKMASEGISPQMFSDLNPNIIAHEIKIDDTTSPEEIENIKKKFPMLADGLDNILNKINPNFSTLPKAIELLSLTQLEKELKKAVGEDNFERATEIRNEINKRKQKK